MGHLANLGGCWPMQMIKALELGLKIGLGFSLNLDTFHIETSHK
jgi:hypothetical protein